MGLRRPARIILFALVLVVATLGAGYLGGVVLADRVNQNRAWEDRLDRTELVLRSMETDLKVGGYLPDHTFENARGEPVSLSSQLTGPTILVFAEPRCAGCVKELTALHEIAADPKAPAQIMVVANYLPQEFEQSVEEFGSYRHYLYDRAAAYAEKLGVFTFPFNIVVGPDLRVLAIDAVNLDEPMFERLMDEVK